MDPNIDYISLRQLALERAIDTVQHFNTWNEDAVLRVADKFETYLLFGTKKESE